MYLSWFLFALRLKREIRAEALKEVQEDSQGKKRTACRLWSGEIVILQTKITHQNENNCQLKRHNRDTWCLKTLDWSGEESSPRAVDFRERTHARILDRTSSTWNVILFRLDLCEYRTGDRVSTKKETEVKKRIANWLSGPKSAKLAHRTVKLVYYWWYDQFPDLHRSLHVTLFSIFQN